MSKQTDRDKRMVGYAIEEERKKIAAELKDRMADAETPYRKIAQIQHAILRLERGESICPKVNNE